MLGLGLGLGCLSGGTVTCLEAGWVALFKIQQQLLVLYIISRYTNMEDFLKSPQYRQQDPPALQKFSQDQKPTDLIEEEEAVKNPKECIEDSPGQQRAFDMFGSPILIMRQMEINGEDSSDQNQTKKGNAENRKINIRTLFTLTDRVNQYEANHMKVFNFHFYKNCLSTQFKERFQAIPKLKQLQKQNELRKFLFRLKQNIKPSKNGSKNPKLFTKKGLSQTLVYENEQNIQYTVFLIKQCQRYLKVFLKQIEEDDEISEDNAKIIEVVDKMIEQIKGPVFKYFQSKFSGQRELMAFLHRKQ